MGHAIAGIASGDIDGLFVLGIAPNTTGSITCLTKKFDETGRMEIPARPFFQPHITGLAGFMILAADDQEVAGIRCGRCGHSDRGRPYPTAKNAG